MAGDDPVARFCLDLGKQFRGEDAPITTAGPWWPYPDSDHGSFHELQLRRTSTSSSTLSQFNRHHRSGSTDSRASFSSLQSDRPKPPRSFSAQHIWQQKDSTDRLSNVGEAESETDGFLQIPQARSGGFMLPKDYAGHFAAGPQKAESNKKRKQQGQHGQGRPQLRRPKSKSTLRMAELMKPPPKPRTVYKRFDDASFGTRMEPSASVGSVERRLSLLSVELKHDDDEEELHVARQDSSDVCTLCKVDSECETHPRDGDDPRRDSGFGEACDLERQIPSSMTEEQHKKPSELHTDITSRSLPVNWNKAFDSGVSAPAW